MTIRGLQGLSKKQQLGLGVATVELFLKNGPKLDAIRNHLARWPRTEAVMILSTAIQNSPLPYQKLTKQMQQSLISESRERREGSKHLQRQNLS